MTRRVEAIKTIQRGLGSLRSITDRHCASIEYGIALGRISMAHLAKLIDTKEADRLYDLALNASNCARRDAQQWEASHG